MREILYEQHKWKCALQASVILLIFFALLGASVDLSFARKLSAPPTLQVTLIPTLPSVKPKAKKAVVTKAKKAEAKPAKKTAPPKPKPAPKPKPKPTAKKPTADIYLKKLAEEEKAQKLQQEAKQREKEKRAELARLKAAKEKEKDKLLAKLRNKAKDQKILDAKKKKEKKRKEDKKKKEKAKKKKAEEVIKKEETKTDQLAKAKEELLEQTEEEREAAWKELIANQAALAEAQAARASYLDNLKSGYMSRIIGRIEDYLITPPSAKKESDILVVLEVKLDEKGSIEGVPRIAESSGIAEYDNAAVRAVIKASPLPMPKDVDLIDEFRFLRLHISPKL